MQVSAWRPPHQTQVMTASAARKVGVPGPGSYDVRTADRHRSDIVRVPLTHTVGFATAPRFTNVSVI